MILRERCYTLRSSIGNGPPTGERSLLLVTAHPLFKLCLRVSNINEQETRVTYLIQHSSTASKAGRYVCQIAYLDIHALRVQLLKTAQWQPKIYRGRETEVC